VEVLLLLGVLLLFIMTDSRTIKFIAKESLDSSAMTYSALEGNLFEGLKVKEVRYKNKKLFDKVTLHWNPLALFHNTLSLTEVDVKGVELENILGMVKELKSNDSNIGFSLPLSLLVENIHFDINPYIYESIKFSDFVLETDRIEVTPTLEINIKSLYLAFDSDLVNVKLDGEVKQNKVLLNQVNLKDISPKAITRLVQRLKKENKKQNRVVNKVNLKGSFLPFTEIRAKHILGTLKPVKYGDLDLQSATLKLDNAYVDPYKNYKYWVKKLDFVGETNFGKFHYRGFDKKSTIYANGVIVLDEELFKKYHLPLNDKSLKHLPSSLKLDHRGVWIEINHKVKKLLKLKNEFNIDIKEGKHKLSYLYGKKLHIESTLEGAMDYADEVESKIKTEVDFSKVKMSYEGKVKVAKFKHLPKDISAYLLAGLEGNFKGDTKGLSVDIVSNLLEGEFETKDYQNATLRLKSKGKNIALNKLVPTLPTMYDKELLSAEASMLMNFKQIEKSTIDLKIDSSLVRVTSQMDLTKPYKIPFKLHLPKASTVRKLNSKIYFSNLENIEGSIVINGDRYTIILENGSDLKLNFDYLLSLSTIENAKLVVGNSVFNLDNQSGKKFELNFKIENLQKTLHDIKKYYRVDLPNIQGALELTVLKDSRGKYSFRLKSNELKYLSDKGVNLSILHFYDIDLNFKVDKDLNNIEIKKYQFKIDENEYLTNFFSNRASLLTLKGQTLELKKFWINDTLLLQGSYDFDSSKGLITAKANRYHFTNREGDIDLLFNLDTTTKVNGKKIDIDGEINLLGNSINYELSGTGVIEDSDIIIVQDMLKEQESSFKNLKLYLKIKSQNALEYRSEDAKIDFFNDITIFKNYGQKPSITGMSTITKGYYQLDEKRFNLDESHLYFTGNVKKPLLDIKANYQKDEYLIHVFISGTTDEPIINFNADPYLTQQEIMSLILFDSTGSSNGRGAEAYTLLGGTFAKTLMKSLGINIDHFVVGKDENDQLSLEVGRRVTDNISVLYLNKDGLSGVKIKIENSKNIETDIIVQPPRSSSIEFLFKRDH
jgi:hypothetical protein